MNLSDFILWASVSLSEKWSIICEFSTVCVVNYNSLSVVFGPQKILNEERHHRIHLSLIWGNVMSIMESQKTIQWGNKGIMSPSQRYTSGFYSITTYVSLSNSQMPINLSFGDLSSELCVSFCPQWHLMSNCSLSWWTSGSAKGKNRGKLRVYNH